MAIGQYHDIALWTVNYYRYLAQWLNSDTTHVRITNVGYKPANAP